MLGEIKKFIWAICGAEATAILTAVSDGEFSKVEMWGLAAGALTGLAVWAAPNTAKGS
jgi:hypothetical protein